jgi:sporulation-control protein spo0M
MGLFDKLKGAVNSVTGGAAKVTMTFDPPVSFPGETVAVKITAISTGAEIESKGLFVDLRGTERVDLNRNDAINLDRSVNVTNHTFEQEFPITGPFKIPANETVEFEGTFTIPAQVQPSYVGARVQHNWEIRGRVDAFGNDPDTGYLAYRIGAKQ